MWPIAIPRHPRAQRPEERRWGLFASAVYSGSRTRQSDSQTCGWGACRRGSHPTAGTGDRSDRRRARQWRLRKGDPRIIRAHREPGQVRSTWRTKLACRNGSRYLGAPGAAGGASIGEPVTHARHRLFNKMVEPPGTLPVRLAARFTPWVFSLIIVLSSPRAVNCCQANNRKAPMRTTSRASLRLCSRRWSHRARVR